MEILSILSFAAGALVLLGALAMTAMASFAWAPRVGMPGPLEMGMLGIMLGIMLLAGTGYLVLGAGLHRRRGWARGLGFVVCGLSLLSIPFGTAYGIYGLYALTRPGVEAVLGGGSPDAGRS